jgi:hypothetical protein
MLATTSGVYDSVWQLDSWAWKPGRRANLPLAKVGGHRRGDLFVTGVVEWMSGYFMIVRHGASLINLRQAEQRSIIPDQQGKSCCLCSCQKNFGFCDVEAI